LRNSRMLGRLTPTGATSPWISGRYVLIFFTPDGTTVVSMIWIAEKRARCRPARSLSARHSNRHIGTTRARQNHHRAQLCHHVSNSATTPQQQPRARTAATAAKAANITREGLQDRGCDTAPKHTAPERDAPSHDTQVATPCHATP
jgi:hypothetical protein